MQVYAGLALACEMAVKFPAGKKDGVGGNCEDKATDEGVLGA
jgi:hypothetical protein